MPIKHNPGEGSRPPLARGSACHRCFVRKVRCSGQPSAESGVHACTSCLRTARFKGHDLAHARCAFHGESLCSEEGGPSMTGEIYSNAGPAPRRKLTSRSTTTSSVSSTRSAASAVSNATDYSFESSGASSHISPVSSTSSLKSMGDQALSASSSPDALHLPPPVTYPLPPALPPSAIPGYAQPYSLPPTHYPQPASTSLPPTPLQFAAPFPGAVRTASDPTGVTSLLSRRTKAAPMSISLPPQPAMVPSPTALRAPSPVGHVASAASSAPLVMPPNWGAPLPQRQQQQQHYSQQYAQQDDLLGAMQAVLTPSTLAKLPGAQSSYDFPIAGASFAPYGVGAATPSLGYAGVSQPMGGYSQAAHGSLGAALPPTPLRSLSFSGPHARSTYAQTNYSAGAYDVNGPTAWSTSFHLPSPGLTFTSSTPHWLAHGSPSASQYFQV